MHLSILIRVVSSGLGIPPTKARNEEVYDVQVKKPVVHSAPITSLVDYDHEQDEDAPDISTREDPEEMEVTELRVEEDKENVRLSHLYRVCCCLAKQVDVPLYSVHCWLIDTLNTEHYSESPPYKGHYTEHPP